jgi:hypothetical protein
MSPTLLSAAGSDVGRRRAMNQDSAAAGTRLLVVADGMGGHVGGDVASSLAIGELAPLDGESHGSDDALDHLSKAVHAAHGELLDRVAQEPALTGMGTTVTALLRTGSRFALAHIGDSRAYLLRDDALVQITHDHTFVQTLVDEGRLTPEEAERLIVDDGGAKCVRSDWRERVKVIRPDLLEFQARRNGITRVEVAQALETSFEAAYIRVNPGDFASVFAASALKPVTIDVYFLSKETRWDVSNFTLYPPDHPGTFVFRTNDVIQKIIEQNKESRATDIFLCLELNTSPVSGMKKEDYSSVKLKISSAQFGKVK